MTFFDPKEDVIDVEITQFGKFLLSKGKWDPIYYAFFDDDIIYDSQYGGVTEGQNDIQARITGSARTRDQYVFSGIETEISKLMQVEMNPGACSEAASEMQKISIQATDDREYALSYPLGRSDTGNQNNPAWAITFFKGELSSSIPYSTSSLGVVPRVQMFADDVKFYTEARNKLTEDPGFVCDEETDFEVEGTLVQVGESSDSQVDPSDLVFANKVYDDGSYIDIKEDYLLLEMLEKNTPFEEDNIDIEVFLYEDNIDTGREVLTPLRFMKKKQAVVDGILLDDDDERNQQADPTPDCVEYFFNVRVDNEIPLEVLCRAVKERTDLGLYAPPIVCPEELVLDDPGMPCISPPCDEDDIDPVIIYEEVDPACDEDVS